MNKIIKITNEYGMQSEIKLDNFKTNVNFDITTRKDNKNANNN